MYTKKYFEVERLYLQKLNKNTLGKIIKKNKIMQLSNKKNDFIFKTTVADSSGCIEFFSTNFINIRIGDLVEISKIKYVYYRNFVRFFGFFSKTINSNIFNNIFKTTLERNYSKKKYRIFRN